MRELKFSSVNICVHCKHAEQQHHQKCCLGYTGKEECECNDKEYKPTQLTTREEIEAWAGELAKKIDYCWVSGEDGKREYYLLCRCNLCEVKRELERVAASKRTASEPVCDECGEAHYSEKDIAGGRA